MSKEIDLDKELQLQRSRLERAKTALDSKKEEQKKIDEIDLIKRSVVLKARAIQVINNNKKQFNFNKDAIFKHFLKYFACYLMVGFSIITLIGRNWLVAIASLIIGGIIKYKIDDKEWKRTQKKT